MTDEGRIHCGRTVTALQFQVTNVKFDGVSTITTAIVAAVKRPWITMSDHYLTIDAVFTIARAFGIIVFLDECDF